MTTSFVPLSTSCSTPSPPLPLPLASTQSIVYSPPSASSPPPATSKCATASVNNITPSIQAVSKAQAVQSRKRGRPLKAAFVIEPRCHCTHLENDIQDHSSCETCPSVQNCGEENLHKSEVYAQKKQKGAHVDSKNKAKQIKKKNELPPGVDYTTMYGLRQQAEEAAPSYSSIIKDVKHYVASQKAVKVNKEQEQIQFLKEAISAASETQKTNPETVEEVESKKDSSWHPGYSTQDQKEEWKVFFDFPGVTSQNLKFGFVGHTLVVSGNRTEPNFTSFEEKVSIPLECNLSAHKASLSNCVLKIVIPKTESILWYNLG